MRSLLSIFLTFIFSCVYGQEVTLLAGGDVTWDRTVDAPGYYYGIKGDPAKRIREDGWRMLPYLATPESRALMISQYGKDPDGPTSHHKSSILFDLNFSSAEAEADYPFLKIAPLLQSADITLVNLETPLSDQARKSGSFRTPTAFAKALKKAGVDLVTRANNHAFDAEGAGMDDTMEALKEAEVLQFGGGNNLEEARKPIIIHKNGMSFAFLGYTYGVNPTEHNLGFALPDRSGVAPMDPFLIKEDIAKLKGQVDFIILVLHWGIENVQEVHPAARDFGHDLLDSGADMIIGHHPHVPRGIEVYKGKPIVYSLGNFIFGHTHTNWMDNFLAKLTFKNKKLTRLEVLPIAGKMDVAQPFLLEGDRAQELLNDIQKRTRELDSEMTIEGNKGVVKLK